MCRSRRDPWESFIRACGTGRFQIRKKWFWNFGVFEIKKTKPKPKARNPKTNEIIYVPSRRKISFKPGKELSLKLKKEWNE